MSEIEDVKELEALEDAPPSKKVAKKEVKVAAKVVTKKKPPPPPVESESEDEAEEVPVPKKKRERTPAQIAAFEKALKTKADNAKKRAAEAKKKADDERAELEKKLVQKALALKKKQIKKAAVLDEISDDDTPVEKIKEIAKMIPAKKQEPKVAFRFI